MSPRIAGINIPVFSLRSKNSMGTGEFLDLIPFIDWAQEAGFQLIQILPVNDTSMTETEKDAYPYSILSAFALHPIYLNIQILAPEFEKEYLPIVKKLNLPNLDYRRTYLTKKELLRMLFVIRGEEDLATKAFEKFFQKNAIHLKTYAAFCSLRDQMKTSNFRKWGKFSKYSELLVDEICQRNEVNFFYFIQFHLHKQLKQVVKYAKEKGVLLKGDFPMGIHPNSVEAWRFFDYFRWNKSMGAPPDFYNDLGQNWGFPSYNWEEIKSEKFYWLISRLEWMKQYFDVLRLDHVLGYFRLWEIPRDQVRGLMGNFFPAEGYTKEELQKAGIADINRLCQPFDKDLPKDLKTQKQVKEKYKNPKERDKFYSKIENCLFFYRENQYHPRIDLENTSSFQALSKKDQKTVRALFNYYYLAKQEELWREKGEETLKCILKNTSLFVCAEDIGVIPKCVEEVLKELKIPNLHIQRMPKSFDISFEDPSIFPENSVCMPSNHDTATLREWWEENTANTTLYYHTILKHEGVPPEKLTEKLAQEIIQSHLNSKSRFAIFLLQDLFAINDALKFPNPKEVRINDPAHSENAWKWRSHIYIEELFLAKSFTQKLHSMIQEARR